MCHGFLAIKDSGERLSHAVGCAFAVCLERKQRRDKECGVTMSFDTKNSTFTRLGSFRHQTLTEQQQRGTLDTTTPSAAILPQPKPFNPFAIERPHATPSMLERQGSFRAFSTIGSQSPFKRQMSLRINDLPSNTERKNYLISSNGAGGSSQKNTLGTGNVLNATSNRSVSPIPELPLSKSPGDLKHLVTADTVNQLCQELSQGLSLLSQTDVILSSPTNSTHQQPVPAPRFTNTKDITQQFIGPIKRQEIAEPTTAIITSTNYTAMSGHLSVSSPMVRVAPAIISSTMANGGRGEAIHNGGELMNGLLRDVTIDTMQKLPRADQWLGQVVHNASPGMVKRQQSLSSIGRTQSLGSVPDTIDPFDAEWAMNITKPLSTELAKAIPSSLAIPPFSQQHQQQPLTIQQHLPTSQPAHSTNPFITTPKVTTAPNQMFQLQL